MTALADFSGRAPQRALMAQLRRSSQGGIDGCCPSARLRSKRFIAGTISREVPTIEDTKHKRMRNVVSALTARTQFGQILRRAAEGDERFVVDRRGKPSVIIMSVRDYIRNVAPTPAAYQAIRKDAKKNRRNSLTMREIDAEIAACRRHAESKNGNLPAP